MENKIPRRQFIKYSGMSSLALLPGVQLLSKVTSTADTEKFVTNAFRLIDYKTLLNLEFYFINTKCIKKGFNTFIQKGTTNNTKYRRDDDPNQSFMIFRLPQQHIAEEYWDPCPGQPLVPDRILQTRISGYSYLVFRIFFDKINHNPKESPQTEGELELSYDSLMNWNAGHFRLVVRQNLNEPIFQISKLKSNDDIHLNDDNAENHYPLGYSQKKGQTSINFDRNNYPKTYEKFTPSPITAIEAPLGLIISPQLPDQDRYRFKWTFSQHSKDTKTNDCELWMATLKVERVPFINNPLKKQQKEIYSEKDIAPQFENDGSDLLRIMILGSADYYKKDKPDINNSFYQNLLPHYLPTTTDRKNIVDLYIHFKLAARASKLTFTPLGICTTIELKNKDIDKNQNPLFQWKQTISFGRDQEVKVVNLVVDSCTGLKMLHVRTTKRLTEGCKAFLHYREFLMPLEIEKNYELYVNENNLNQYTQANYKANTPFKKIRFADMKPKRITSLAVMSGTGGIQDLIVKDQGKTPVDSDKPNADCNENGAHNASDVFAFWPLQYQHDINATNKRFLECEFIATDWHDNEIKIKKRLFILTQSLTLKKSQKPDTKAPQKNQTSFELESKALSPLSFETIYAEVKDGIEKNYWDIGKIQTEVKNRLSNTKYGIDKLWTEIHRKSEEYWLNLSDLYRLRLEQLLGKMESIVQANAGQIEDKVMEEFALYKASITELGNRLFGDVNEFVHRIELQADGEVKKIIDRFKSQFNSYLKEDIDLKEYYKAELKIRIQEFKNDKLILAVTQKIEEKEAEFKKLSERIDQIPNILNADALELDNFLNALPARVAGRMRSALQKPAEDLRKLIIEIESIEHAAKSKIELGREKIGYAVYRVEEDLKSIKQRLQNDLKDEWQKVYEEYSKKYFEINKQVSELQTEYILLRNNIRSVVAKEKEVEKKIFDFFHEYSCFPQLHTAKVFIQKVNDLVHGEIPMKIKYAEDYFKNQADAIVLNARNNTARVFAEIKQEAKEQLKGAMRKIGHEMGGIVNPALAADFLSYYQDKRDKVYQALNEVKEIGDMAKEDVEHFLKSTKDVLNNEYQNYEGELVQYKKEYEDFKKRLIDLANGEKEKIKKIKGVIKDYENDFKKAKDQLILITDHAKKSIEENAGLAKMKAEEFFKGLEAKILGAIKVKDILGIDFEPPKLDRKNNSLYYHFITENLKDVTLGPFAFIASNERSKSKLILHFEKSLVNSTYKAWTRLSDFRVSVFSDRLIIHFQKLEMISNENVKNKVSVKINNVEFKNELAFLKALSEGIKLPGIGLTLKLTPQGVNADFFFALPNISGGAFSFNNLKFGVGVTIPFPTGGRSLSELVTRFSINSPEDKFAIGVAIFGGRGHFVLETTPKYISKIDCALEFGGYLSLNLVIAQGEAFLMAGIRYIYFRDPDGETGMEFYAYLTCGGHVTVFGFIDISVCFVLCLRYQKYNGHSSLYGVATLSFSVKIAFFSISFSLSFSKRFMGSDYEGSNPDGAFLDKRHFLPNNGPIIHDALYVQQESSEDLFHYTGNNNNGENDDDDDEPPKTKVTRTAMFTKEGLKRYCHSFN